MPRPIKQLCAAADVVAELRRRSRSTTIGVRDRERADMILHRLDGVGVEAVAEQLNTTPKRVSLWCVRFEASGLDGLSDKPGRGRKASIPEAKVARVITEATRPPKGRPILPSVTPIQGRMCGGPRAPRSSPKSDAHAQRSTKRQSLELMDGI